MIRKKILLLGDFAVGKSSLIRRYIDNTFDDKYLTTIGVKISKKLLTINDIECEMLIWDIEGATPVKKIPKSYFGGASGAIFVCDVDRADTMEHLKGHIDEFMIINSEAKYVVAYNKSDLLSDSSRGVFDLKKNEFFTSAKDNENVEKLFGHLAKEILS